MSRGHGGTWGQLLSAMAPALIYQTTHVKSLLSPASSSPSCCSRAVCVHRVHYGGWTQPQLGPSDLTGAKNNCATFKDGCSHEFTSSGNSSASGFSEEEEGITQPCHSTPLCSPPLCQNTVVPVLQKPNLKTMKMSFLTAKKERGS